MCVDARVECMCLRGFTKTMVGGEVHSQEYTNQMRVYDACRSHAIHVCD